ncbi:hypothetical protein WDB89_05320 [Pseudoalteromonas sp. B5MOD-1]|uniref:hypothetical protein n=1 Tax=Pseudoalteromonas TaxID=53246 RepID=UPI0007839CD9|nr:MULTISPECIES: hypothetical protein [Pseudoalteromonas]MCO7207502.1 hypothetical protein [Pseudoalteromonas sp. CnMc7-37]NRA76981.1 hypothetical protein [Pseudoalteromonas sp.]
MKLNKLNIGTESLSQIDFRPYMIECAYDYYMVAKTASHQRMGLQSVLSVLSIEILFKSFNALAVDNIGQPNETYIFDRNSLPKKSDPHDLITLYHSLPDDIAKFLVSENELEILHKYRSSFKSSRYTYEPSANKSHRDDIIKLTAKLLCYVVLLYKQQGCKDSFIQYFDVEELYFKDVQKFLGVY